MGTAVDRGDSTEQPRTGGTNWTATRNPAGSCVWLLVEHVPWMFLKLFGVDRGDYEAASHDERPRVRALLDTLVPVEPRKLGILNDERLTNTAMVERYDEYDLESLQVPTLVIHAEDDPLASFEDASRMARRLPDVEFHQYESGGHHVCGHGDEIRQVVSEFIRAR